MTNAIAPTPSALSLFNFLPLVYNDPVRKDRLYWLHLLRFALTAVAIGAAGAVLGYVLLSASAYAHSLTHPPCIGSGLTPTDVGLDSVQDVSYHTDDGLTLHAWYLEAQNGNVIILLPGLGGSRNGMLREGAILARHGYGLLLTELRSCVHPDGLSTLGYYESADLASAVSWVLQQENVAHVGVLGYSLGGVTAIMGTAADERVEAVVAEGGFYDLAADILDKGHDSPLWRQFIYRAVLFFFRRESGVDAGDISPISVVSQISPRPLLLVYGELETTASRPWEQLARAGEPKELWIVPDCGHGLYLDVASDEWEERITTFFDRALVERD